MQRRLVKQSKELRAAIELQNTANRAAKVESRKPRWAMRAEASAVVRELKHDSMMTKAQRSRAEATRQIRLSMQRAKAEATKRVGEILKGLGGEEKKTELGIVLPSGEQIGKVLSGVRDKTV